MSTIELKNKIALFNELYEEIAGHGRNGDTELAHINILNRMLKNYLLRLKMSMKNPMFHMDMN